MAKFGRTKQETVIMAVVLPLLFLWSLTLIYPFVWALLNSLKDMPEFYDDSFSLPKQWLFSNWIKAFNSLEIPKSNPLYNANLWEMIFHSVWFTIIGALLNLTTTAMLAYAVAKYKFRLCKILYSVSVVVMMIPIMGSLATEYKYFNLWGLSNSPVFLVTALGCIGSGTFLILHSAFKSIPWSYAEAVYVDGGGNWTAFLRIMLPQAMPILSALFILGCIGRWNDFMTPYLYLGDYPTLATGLFRLEGASTTANNKPIYFAAVLISALPIFVTFIVFSGKIMTSVSIGGLKG